MRAGDPYSADAEFYDLIHGLGGEDVGLWLSLAGRTVLPVLEVGVGTGRIGLALVRAGHNLVGIDSSTAMLEFARKAADDDALETITFFEGDVSEASLDPGFFGFVLIPADVFLYCRDGEEQLAMLRQLAAALSFDGCLALDLPGPASWLDPASNGQPLLVFSAPLGDEETLDVWHVHEDDLALQTRLLRINYEVTRPDGTVNRRMSEHHLRYVGRFELEYLLGRAGLAQLDVYGDYDLGSLTNDSERMIVLARRTEG